MTEPKATIPHRVIIIEDDDYLRDHVTGILSATADMAVVGTAATMAAGMALVDCAPDLAILDLGLPDGNGATIIDAMRQQHPRCRFLVFTIFEDRASVLNTLRAGADGYVLKDSSANQLLAYIRATVAGETPISARAASHLLSLVRHDPQPADAMVVNIEVPPPLSPSGLLPV